MLKSALKHAKSALNTCQTKPKTQTKPKSEPKTQTEQAQSSLKKISNAQTNIRAIHQILNMV
jgi:Sec-independent protein translocase protein TatA